MKDGLQNVSLDRVLMRIKDVMSILSSIISIITMVLGGLWITFKFINAQNEQQKMMNLIIQSRMPRHSDAQRN